MDGGTGVTVTTQEAVAVSVTAPNWYCPTAVTVLVYVPFTSPESVKLKSLLAPGASGNDGG